MDCLKTMGNCFHTTSTESLSLGLLRCSQAFEGKESPKSPIPSIPVTKYV